VTVEKVRADYGAGRMFLAKDALKAGLVDRVETLEESMKRLSSGGVVSRAAAQASDELAGDTGPIEVDGATQAMRSARLVELLSPRRAKGGV
jgi:enoyl-CoA hydratase/carnithine racemase